MPNIKFNRFYRYAELTRLLKAYAKEYPNLIRLESIGKSYEGRDVWLVTATNFKSGAKRKTNVILFWLSGGPSHIDMWDPKPEAPSEIRGPFGHIPTKVTGIHVCEHLPLTAQIMDRLTLLRSVDCSASNHTPITMQACNPLARRTNDGRDGGGWPSMGSNAAKFRGANAPGIPGYVALADSLPADIWGAGHMGGDFEPVRGKNLSGRHKLSEGLTIERLGNRHDLLEQMND